MNRAPQPGIEDDDDESSESGLDTELLLSYLAFGVRAVKKRLRLLAVLFVVAVALLVGVVTILTRTYYFETLLITKTAKALTSIDEKAPALESAAASLTRDETLKAIVRQTQLASHWDATRAPPFRAKDWIMERVRGPVPDEDKAELLANMLRDRLATNINAGVLTISVTWPDAQMAKNLVEAARQNFLEICHIDEISTLAENTSILEAHVARVRKEIYDIAQNAVKMREEKRAKLLQEQQQQRQQAAAQQAESGAQETAAVRMVRAVHPPKPEVDENLAATKVMLEAKEQALKELEGERTRSLRDLQGKLRDLKLIYTEEHPQVALVKDQIAALSKVSPQVDALRGEVTDLRGKLRDQSARSGTSVGTRSWVASRKDPAAPEERTPQLPPELLTLMRDSVGDVDPTVTAQFELAVRRYSGLQDEISTSRIELDRAQAAFKHRYQVITPARVPDKPIKPKVAVIVAGGVVASLLLVLLIALIAELRTGRLVERWQVQQLKLPILVEIGLPPAGGSSRPGSDR